jgi:hypothetical protein
MFCRAILFAIVAACAARPSPSTRPMQAEEVPPARPALERSVTGTFGGYAWSTDEVMGVFFEHADEGVVVRAAATTPEWPKVLAIELASCGAAWSGNLTTLDRGARAWYGALYDDPVPAVDGTIEVLSCEVDRLHVRFSARFEDGMEASGAIVTPLVVDARPDRPDA